MAPFVAAQVSPPPTLTRCAPASAISLKRQPEACEGEDVDRLRDRAADGLDLVGAAQPGRVEHVRPGLLEGAQPGDRVVEIRVAAQVVLGAGRQGEWEVERPGGLGGGRDALDRLVRRS